MINRRNSPQGIKDGIQERKDKMESFPYKGRVSANSHRRAQQLRNLESAQRAERAVLANSYY